MNIIDQILARLDDGRLWQKHGYGQSRRADTPVCLLGAQMSILPLRGIFPLPEITQVVREQYGDHPALLDSQVVTQFNDDDHTCFAHVRVVLEKASLLYDEHNA